MTRWVVSQIGAREHYAVARSLAACGNLQTLITDAWVTPDSLWKYIPGCGKLADRFHEQLKAAQVVSPTGRSVAWEAYSRLRGLQGWDKILARNRWYQQFAVSRLKRLQGQYDSVFSYSYTAFELLKYCEKRGVHSVVGQIDPGPVEERIVAEEHERYPWIVSQWRRAPAIYWDDWRCEMDLADRIVVNSDWSRECLVHEGVRPDKIQLIPLVYEPDGAFPKAGKDATKNTFDVLFLGQINLRKGIARLIEAMRLLANEKDIRLILAGPTEVDPKLWAGMANVTWRGPVRRSEVHALYQAADVFILPTLSDGYALTQLEALANALPVIASKNCGMAVQAGVTGLILPDLDPQTIAETIVKSQEFRNIKIGNGDPSFGLLGIANGLSTQTW